jgi:hypothetical protein
MATAHVKLALIVLVANIATMAAAAASVPNLKQKQATISVQLKELLQKLEYILANVKHLPKKGRGAKEVVVVVVIVGSM